MDEFKINPRDASFAGVTRTKLGAFLFRAAENLTGRIFVLFKLSKFKGFFNSMAWSDLLDHFGTPLEIDDQSFANIPKDGAVLVYSNHPFGMLDGLVLGALLQRRRKEFRIIAIDALNVLPGIGASVLPVSFEKDEAAKQRNAKTRAAAVQYLREGGIVGTFPAGTVAGSTGWWTRPLDAEWTNKTAAMALESGATLVPLYFHGANSRLFQIASHIGNAPRCALMFSEFRRRYRRPLKVSIGPGYSAVSGEDADTLNARMRAALYDLSGNPDDLTEVGFSPTTSAPAQPGSADGRAVSQ